MSNPKLRRAELMTRIAGFEAIAKQRGDVGELYRDVSFPHAFSASKKLRAILIMTRPRQDRLSNIFAASGPRFAPS